MKYVLTVITVIFLNSSGYSQTHQLGVKAGLNWAFVNQHSNWINSARRSFAGGITYQWNFDENFQFGSELLYDQRGYQTSTFYGRAPSDTQIKEAEFKYNYLAIPLKFGYRTAGDFSAFLNAGIVPSYLLDAAHHYYWYPDIDPVDATDYISRFDIAGLAEVGGSYSLHNTINFFVSLSYQHSLTSLSNQDYFGDEIVKNRVLTLFAGLRTKL